MPRSRPLIITIAIYTALGVFLGGAALADWLSKEVIGLATLLVVASRAGIDYYIQATTTPSDQVVATQEKAGAPVIAGPQSQVTTGVALQPGATVEDVVPPPPPNIRAA